MENTPNHLFYILWALFILIRQDSIFKWGSSIKSIKLYIFTQEPWQLLNILAKIVLSSIKSKEDDDK